MLRREFILGTAALALSACQPARPGSSLDPLIEPEHKHYHRHEYDYYPDHNVYFHPFTGFYFFHFDGYWRRSRRLPRHIRLRRARRFRMRHRGGAPYRHNKVHRGRFHRKADGGQGRRRRPAKDARRRNGRNRRDRRGGERNRGGRRRGAGDNIR